MSDFVDFLGRLPEVVFACKIKSWESDAPRDILSDIPVGIELAPSSPMKEKLSLYVKTMMSAANWKLLCESPRVGVHLSFVGDEDEDQDTPFTYVSVLEDSVKSLIQAHSTIQPGTEVTCFLGKCERIAPVCAPVLRVVRQHGTGVDLGLGAKCQQIRKNQEEHILELSVQFPHGDAPPSARVFPGGIYAPGSLIQVLLLPLPTPDLRVVALRQSELVRLQSRTDLGRIFAGQEVVLQGEEGFQCLSRVVDLLESSVVRV